MAIYQLEDRVPDIHPSAFVHDDATIIGSVIMHANTSVWPNVVARGDTAPMVIGEGSNIQDGTVLHADHDQPLIIGKNVTVGHLCMLHGCTIGDGSLIGIQSVVLNRSVIGKDCLVGAGSIVTEGKSFPDRSMILGSPAKVVRELSEENASRLAMSAESYVKRSQDYKANLKRIG